MGKQKKGEKSRLSPADKFTYSLAYKIKIKMRFVAYILVKVRNGATGKLPVRNYHTRVVVKKSFREICRERESRAAGVGEMLRSSHLTY